MLGRRANRRSSEQRFHPLVREFLEDRLRREIGNSGVEDLHVAVAAWAEPSDWQTAAHHYAEAGRWRDLQRVLEVGVETIVAVGAFVAAAQLIDIVPDPPPSVPFEVIRSRIASLSGDLDRTLLHANRAVELQPDSEIAISNLMFATLLSGDVRATEELASRLVSSGRSPLIRDLGAAMRMTLAASLEGNLVELARHLEQLAERNRVDGHLHYEGVSLLNSSLTYRAIGDSGQVPASGVTGRHPRAGLFSSRSAGAAPPPPTWGSHRSPPSSPAGSSVGRPAIRRPARRGSSRRAG
jgi:hypothetical protein